MNSQTDRHHHQLKEYPSDSVIFSYEEAQRKKKNSNKNKRRFSDEQIKLLETIFETETKLGPRKKLQLAKELGLQPRQIAIWFQNRRARWKSKRIEHEFNLLKANYDQLLSSFESLKNERQSLLQQLKKLNELLGEPYDENMNNQEDYKIEICTNIENTNNNINNGNNNNNCHAQDQELDKRSILMSSEDNQNREISVSGDEFTDGSLASPDQWYNFDSMGQFDQQWFDCWT